MTRGPLPARVYWTRRLLLVSVVVGLVLTGVGVVKLAGGDPGTPEQARLAGSTTDPSDEGAAGEPDDEPTGRVKNGRGEGTAPARSSARTGVRCWPRPRGPASTATSA